jgi:hypothetical protein
VGGGCVLALIPFFGLVTWFIAGPLILSGLVLAIVTIVKGRTTGGIFLMLFSLFVAPAVLVLGPIVAAFAGVAALGEPLPPAPPGSSIAPSALSSAPTTAAEMAAHAEKIKRQLDAKAAAR